MNAIAWTVQQMGRKDLPGRGPVLPPAPKRDLVRAAFDRTWRGLPDVQRIAGASYSVVYETALAMLDAGEIERRTLTRGHHQYRRAQ